MRSRFWELINLPMGILGVEVSRIAERRTSSMPNWVERLHHAKKLGFFPRTIIDGGAFQGLWSVAVAEMFPESQIVLIEPNPFLEDEIRRNISGILPPPVVLPVALGEMPEEGSLNIWGDVKLAAGASLLPHVQGEAEMVVPVRVDTLDSISEMQGLTPNLVKLDLQGGELLALRGGTRVLREAEIFMIEFGCLEAYEDRATPRDIIDMMYDNEYCLYDIVDCHYRPYDGAMTGGDFIFVKNWSVLRRYEGWS